MTIKQKNALKNALLKHLRAAWQAAFKLSDTEDMNEVLSGIETAIAKLTP